jgi:hypothetical protein
LETPNLLKLSSQLIMSAINSGPPTLTHLVSNGYPTCSDGDVMIVSSTGRYWKLHSILLSNASARFQDMMKQFPAKHITKSQQESGVTLKWRFNMVQWEEEPKETRFRSFQVVVSSRPFSSVVSTFIQLFFSYQEFSSSLTFQRRIQWHP